jgi:transposase
LVTGQHLLFFPKSKIMKITEILGIDVSKNSLDCFLYSLQLSLEPAINSEKGFKSISKWLKKNVGKDLSGLMVVMEHTGIYTWQLEQYLHKQGIAYVKRPALDIKRSVGMVRGKSDKVDARFISKYGWMRKEELTAVKPLSSQQFNLQQLMNYRDKLVADRASYQSRLKELSEQAGKSLHEKIQASAQYIMDVLTVEIKQIEAEIEKLINEDEALTTNYELIRSVVGIGFATAVHVLISTENFSRFTDPRKFNCYCGVAPFEHTSGSSIRGKTRVSHLANKKLKSLLTMAAISAVRFDPELKLKYEQKVKEGKAKMSALNIIRAKLIERIFAVIRKQTKYELRTAA